MQIKKLPQDTERKQFNIKLAVETVEKIKSRAEELGMSVHYYISALTFHDFGNGLIEKLGDPYDNKDDTSADKLKEEIAKLQAELERVTSHQPKASSAQTPVQPPNPQQRQIIPPRMLSRQDLIQAEQSGKSALQLSINPSITREELEVRKRLMEQEKEDLAERERARRILEGIDVQ